MAQTATKSTITACPHPELCKVRTHRSDAARAECRRRGRGLNEPLKTPESVATQPQAMLPDVYDHPQWEGSAARGRLLHMMDSGVVCVTDGHDEGSASYRGPAPRPDELKPHPHYEGIYRLTAEACADRGLDPKADIDVRYAGTDDGQRMAIFTNAKQMRDANVVCLAAGDAMDDEGDGYEATTSDIHDVYEADHHYDAPAFVRNVIARGDVQAWVNSKGDMWAMYAPGLSRATPSARAKRQGYDDLSGPIFRIAEDLATMQADDHRAYIDELKDVREQMAGDKDVTPERFREFDGLITRQQAELDDYEAHIDEHAAECERAILTGANLKEDGPSPDWR